MFTSVLEFVDLPRPNTYIQMNSLIIRHQGKNSTGYKAVVGKREEEVRGAGTR